MRRWGRWAGWRWRFCCCRGGEERSEAEPDGAQRGPGREKTGGRLRAEKCGASEEASYLAGGMV